MTYEKLTPSGNLSPALRAVIVVAGHDSQSGTLVKSLQMPGLSVKNEIEKHTTEIDRQTEMRRYIVRQWAV